MLAAAAIAVAHPAAAQEIIVDELSYGETVANFLTTGDGQLQDGSYYAAYQFLGTGGDSVTIAMASRDFNVHVILADSTDTVLTDNADGGGSCNAHLHATLPVSGRYMVYATSQSANEIGQFQLTLQRGTVPPETDAPCLGYFGPQGILRFDRVHEGRFDDSSRTLADSLYYDVWTFAPRNDPFTIDVESDDFDAMAFIVQGFSTRIATDDDGGTGCNARLTLTPTDPRPLRLVVISRGARMTGAYRVTVSEGEQPTVDQPTCARKG